MTHADPTPRDDAALLTLPQVAALLACSTRHVRRLVDRAEMPPPIRLGGLSRWRRVELERWLAAGCPGQAQADRG